MQEMNQNNINVSVRSHSSFRWQHEIRTNARKQLCLHALDKNKHPKGIILGKRSIIDVRHRLRFVGKA